MEEDLELSAPHIALSLPLGDLLLWPAASSHLWAVQIALEPTGHSQGEVSFT